MFLPLMAGHHGSKYHYCQLKSSYMQGFDMVLGFYESNRGIRSVGNGFLEEYPKFIPDLDLFTLQLSDLRLRHIILLQSSVFIRYILNRIANNASTPQGMDAQSLQV